MDILGIIIHKVDKESGSKCKVTKVNHLHSVNEDIVKFVSKIHSNYQKGTRKGQGTFNLDEKNKQNSFVFNLDNYLNHKLDFVDFTKLSIDILESKMNSATNSNGGFVIFVEFSVDYVKKMLILIMNLDLDGFIIDESNEKIDIRLLKLLNIDDIKIATILNLTEYNNNNDSYLTFTNSDPNNFQKYFLDFIGCENYINSKLMTDTLIRVIQNYRNENPSIGTYEEVNTKLSLIFQDESINIMSIANKIDPEHSYDLLSELSKPEHNLSTEFNPNSQALIPYQRFSSSFDSISISFPKNLLGNTIFFNDEDNSITIKDISDKLRNDIQSYLGSN